MRSLPNDIRFEPSDKEAAALWALRLVKSGNFVLLDTETTGLDLFNDVPCQIAVVASDGTVLLDTLVKPHIPISLGAAAVHGISSMMVADAPGYADIHVSLIDLLAGKDVVIYNAGYDVAMLRNAHRAAGLDFNQAFCFWHCAMKNYAAWHGEWSDWHGDYKFQKLDSACHRLKVECDTPNHTALGDALRTLGVVKALAAWAERNIDAVHIAAWMAREQ